MKPTRTVKTADTLLGVINHLQRLEGAGVTELSEYLGLAKSTVHDHLATLREHGYVVKRGDTYHLSLRFLDHGTYARDQLTFAHDVRPTIQRLAEDTEEMVWFAAEERGELVYLLRAVGPRGVGLVCRPGTRAPIHTTAPGKVILANFSNDRVREIADREGLVRETSNTVTDVEMLLNELERVREDGIATTRGEAHLGLTSVAAAVSIGGETLGAVSVSGPEQRLSEGRLDDVTSDLLATVNEIELRLSMHVCE